MSEIHKDQDTLDGAGFDAQELSERLRCIHEAVTRIEQAGLTRRALVVLLKDRCSVSMRDINAVLDAMGELHVYLSSGASDPEGED